MIPLVREVRTDDIDRAKKTVDLKRMKTYPVLYILFTLRIF